MSDEPINYPNHPAAEIFPMLCDRELLVLGRDIQVYRQRDPIVLYKEQVLDGRNRKAACEALGIEPHYCELDDDDPKFDPVAYVLSANLHRRHLTTAQRSMIAARVLELEKSKAKDRQRQGRENLPDPSSAGRARDKAGSLLCVSGRSVDQAAKVIANGVPDLIDMVERGEVSISAAAEASESSPESQAKAAKCGKYAVNQLASRRRTRKRRAQKSDKPAPRVRDEQVEEWESLRLAADARRASNETFNRWYRRAEEVLSNADATSEQLAQVDHEATAWTQLWKELDRKWIAERTSLFCEEAAK